MRIALCIEREGEEWRGGGGLVNSILYRKKCLLAVAIRSDRRRCVPHEFMFSSQHIFVLTRANARSPAPMHIYV